MIRKDKFFCGQCAGSNRNSDVWYTLDEYYEVFEEKQADPKCRHGGEYLYEDATIRIIISSP